jgi:hypothetical protein
MNQTKKTQPHRYGEAVFCFLFRKEQDGAHMRRGFRSIASALFLRKQIIFGKGIAFSARVWYNITVNEMEA